MEGPLIDNNSSGGTAFQFSALSGGFSTNNPSSIRIFGQSNMLFSGAGFTRATPVISPPPVIHGFSEITSGTVTVNASNGRQVYDVQIDNASDDVYLYDSLTGKSERISRSTFGFPVNYLPSDTTSMPSNRFPSISGDGRHVFFSSDASGIGGLVLIIIQTRFLLIIILLGIFFTMTERLNHYPTIKLI